MLGKLEPLTSYYLRKLLRQYGNDLRSIVAQGAAIKVDCEADLDLDRVLESLYLDLDEIANQSRLLDNLVRCHQVLSKQAQSSSPELETIEQQIFWILGLTRSVEPGLLTLS